MNRRNNTYTRLAPISEGTYQEASRRADLLPIYTKSHRKGAANGVGCLGEVIAESWMAQNEINFRKRDKTTHDYEICLPTGETLTIDVKTKDRTCVPLIDYDNSVPLYNHDHQRPDYFLYISLQRSKDDRSDDIRRFKTAYILGGISYEELNKIGIVFYGNEPDWRNKTNFWTDCLNVACWQLIPNRQFLSLLKGSEVNIPNADINYPVVNIIRELIEQGRYRDRNLPC